jgi:hypothetical protein
MSANQDCCCPLVWGGTSRDPRPDPNRIDPECPVHSPCECQLEGYFHSGLPGVLAGVIDGRIVSKVERCDTCERYDSDEEAHAALIKFLGTRNPSNT